MVYVREYWNDRANRAEKAKQHTKDMETRYKNQIDAVVRNTKTYGTDFDLDPNGSKLIKIIVEDTDTVSAASKYKDGKCALLNFSSYVHPGGKFIEGSKAQEECICHESFLYNVLFEFENSFYAWNNKYKNRALYTNRGLYSPGIVFEHNGKAFIYDVITCAAPNKSAAQKYQDVSNAENTKCLRARIKFVLDMAKDNEVNTLILGAYGCGVFGQDPEEVAGIFKEYLDSSHKCFDNVVFAIPSGTNGNLEAFKKVFKM